MKNFNEVIDGYYFHDSNILSFNIDENGKLTIQICYYNWEGNEERKEGWIYKNCTIEVEHCLHFRFSNPGLSRFDMEIQDHTTLNVFELINNEIENYIKERSVTVVENCIAVRFLTHSYGEAVFGETTGFLEVGGLNAKIIWAESDQIGSPIHILAGKN